MNDVPVADTPATVDRRTLRRRRIEIVWVLLSVAYGIGRAVVVAVTLSEYGVNPWVYGAIDAVTSVPLGIATARVVGAGIDRRWSSVHRWALIAGAAFIAPDVSILVMGGGRLPFAAYVIVGVVVFVSATVSLRAALGKMREGRASN